MEVLSGIIQRCTTSYMPQRNREMSDSRLYQFREEAEGWKRTLEFIIHENVFLKNRISEALKSNLASEFLDQADFFQNLLVKRDDAIRLLRHEVAEQGELLGKNPLDDGTAFSHLARKQKKIRSQVTGLADNFIQLRKTFNDFITEKT